MRIGLKRDCCEELRNYFPKLKVEQAAPGGMPFSFDYIVECTEEEAQRFLRTVQRRAPIYAHDIVLAIKYRLD